MIIDEQSVRSPPPPPHRPTKSRTLIKMES